MSHTSTEYKTFDVRQGDVALGLSEYLSRGARFKLVRAVIEAIENGEHRYSKKMNKRIQLNKLPSKVGACKILATYLGTSKRTVERWASKGCQSCNVNAEKLLNVALDLASEETFIILDEDLENHRFLFEYMIGGVRQGDVALGQVVVA